MDRKALVTVWAGLGSLFVALLAVVSGLAVGAVPPSWHWAHDWRLLWGVTAGLVLVVVAVAVIQARSPDSGEQPAGPAVWFGKIKGRTVNIQVAAQTVPGTEKRPESATVAAAGQPLDKVTDPFALEVHRPIQPDNPPPGLPPLPPYVTRKHDTKLGRVVRAAVEGSSEIAVLVGESSTGKTRACWEALQPLRDRPEQWRLWHPIDPSRPDAALRELPAIGPRTVVWLNEAQFYLDFADGGLGERVAAGLRKLLSDPDRAPVLVLATLWPQYWRDLTARPAAGADPHAQARELLDGHDITVLKAFTSAQLRRLGEAGDARLAQAAAGVQDGQVIQFLAGGHELLAQYRNATPAAAALINAAMDARRLGMGIGLPQAFLEAAATGYQTAPGYLTDTEWDALGEDWLEQTLANLGVPSKGVRGPLTRIRSHPSRSGAPGPGSRDSDEQLTDGQAGIAGMPLYRLADYLDQHGRAHRTGQFPPAGLWAAAANHAFPSDQAALGHAAVARGLYRDAAQLHKKAAGRGNLDAVLYLSNPRYLRNDVRPVRWAIDHAPLSDPYAVAALLDSLRNADAKGQVTALLHRDPAAHVSLDNPYAVAALLYSLRNADAKGQAAALLHRDPAAHVSLDDPAAVAWLLYRLREAGAQEQAAALAERAAAHVSLDDPRAVAELLGRRRETGAAGQAAALLHRDPAAHVSLDDPAAVAFLLERLREADAQGQITALLHRDPAAHVSLDDPGAVATLLYSLREADAQEQVTALAERAIAHVSLDDPYAVASLLDSLRQADAQEQAAALLHRDPAAHVSPDNPYAVASLLYSLREAGAQDQVNALAERAAAHVSLDDPRAVAFLLGRLRETGAAGQAAALLHRDPAAHVSLDDPAAVAFLLETLREADAQGQIAALLHRDPAAHVSLDDPRAVAELLDSLRKADAQEQVTALLQRDPAAHVSLDSPRAGLIPRAVLMLLSSLQEAGAAEQATALADRLPGAGMFELFRGQEGRQDRFPFGREANGSPAGPWDWEDLD